MLEGEIESNECEISPLTSYAREGLKDELISKNILILECPFRI